MEAKHGISLSLYFLSSLKAHEPFLKPSHFPMFKYVGMRIKL